MKVHRGVLYLTVAMGLALGGCAEGGVRHGWIMRGQVLTVDGDVATVCVGSRDGAKVGQVLTVERITVKPAPSPKSGSPTFSRSDIGRVKIIQLYGEHYARAQVVAGSPAINDVVEFELR